VELLLTRILSGGV